MYETIQPVVEKEVIQHTVHHTVVPIHEVVHTEPKFEGVTALKPLTMAEFQASGGVLGPHGKNANIDHFATGSTVAPTTGTSGTSSGASNVASPTGTSSTATSRALDSATARSSGHTRGTEGTGSISNLETKTERKFPLASGDATSQTLPVRSSNVGGSLDGAQARTTGTTVTSPTTTTTTTTKTHTSNPIAPVNATPRTAGASNTLSPAATLEAKRGDASLAGVGKTSSVSPISSRKSVDTGRKSTDGRKSVDGRRSGEHDGEKKEGLLKRMMHKLE